MAGSMRIGDGALTRISKEIITKKDELDKDFGDLEKQIVEMGNQWSGRGAQAFGTSYQNLQEQARKVLNAMIGLADRLDGAEKTYTEVEETVASGFNRYDQGLG